MWGCCFESVSCSFHFLSSGLYTPSRYCLLIWLLTFWALYAQEVLPADLIAYILPHTHTHTHTHTHHSGLKVDASSHSDEWKTRKLHSSTRSDASYQWCFNFIVYSTVWNHRLSSLWEMQTTQKVRMSERERNYLANWNLDHQTVFSVILSL